MPLSFRRRPRRPVPGQLVLFDLVDLPAPGRVLPEPGTTLTPRSGRADGHQESAAFGPQPWGPPTTGSAAGATGPVAPASHDEDAAAVRLPAERVFHDPEGCHVVLDR